MELQKADDVSFTIKVEGQYLISNSPSLILKERLRQARLSFNLALIMTAVTTSVSLISIGLLLSNKASMGVITTIGGGASIVYCFKLTKDANDRLDRIAAELDDKP
jgi:hypothetical protein